MGTRHSIITACYCKDMIQGLISEIEEEHADWRSSLEFQPVEGSEGVSRLNIRKDSMPSFDFEFAGVPINKLFLLDKLIQDFFQYSRNAFDSMSQAVNAACLASKAKKIEKVDFPALNRVFNQEPYGTAFPAMKEWFAQVSSSAEFGYIDMYCNRTKHTNHIKNHLSLPLLGGKSEAVIKPFSRHAKDEVIQNERKEIAEIIPACYEFLSKAYALFIQTIKQEVEKVVFPHNRYYKLSVYQQKLKNHPEQEFSLAFIEPAVSFDEMPDEIQVLLTADHEKEADASHITAMNCPFDSIYVKDPSHEHCYLGRYVAETESAEDDLLRFRKYIKEPNIEGGPSVLTKAMMDKKQKGVFYHSNPYVDVYTTSDDPEFQERVSLPI